MSISLTALRNHLDYTAWATLRLIDTAGNLSDEELSRDFQTADRTVVATLAHVYFADRLWLARIKGEPFAGPLNPAECNLAFLRTEFPKLQEQWRQWAASLTDDAPSHEVSYVDLKQNSYTQPLWQIILHVVNHATHHRGQVSGFIRSMGHTPPPLDFAAYCRRQF